MRPHGPSNFCSQCGSALSPGDAFCSECGTPVGGGSATSSPSRNRDFRRRVEDLTVEGWDVKHDYGDRVVMIDRGFGSIPLHALLLFTTSGVGNVLYAWYCYSPGADRIELRADGSETYYEDETFSTSWTTRSAFAFAVSVFTGAFSVLLALFFFLTGWGGTTLILGSIFFLIGLFSLSIASKHVPGFRSVTTFGCVRSTDEETVYEPSTPCSACANPVGNGVKRTYHERKYVAGIPVKTLNEGHNHYCRSCARGDVGIEDEYGFDDAFETETI